LSCEEGRKEGRKVGRKEGRKIVKEERVAKKETLYSVSSPSE
jgi:hypothetical protein